MQTREALACNADLRIAMRTYGAEPVDLGAHSAFALCFSSGQCFRFPTNSKTVSRTFKNLGIKPLSKNFNGHRKDKGDRILRRYVPAF
jgi:hypothetical protein